LLAIIANTVTRRMARKAVRTVTRKVRLRPPDRFFGDAEGIFARFTIWLFVICIFFKSGRNPCSWWQCIRENQRCAALPGVVEEVVGDRM